MKTINFDVTGHAQNEIIDHLISITCGGMKDLCKTKADWEIRAANMREFYNLAVSVFAPIAISDDEILHISEAFDMSYENGITHGDAQVVKFARALMAGLTSSHMEGK